MNLERAVSGEGELAGMRARGLVCVFDFNDQSVTEAADPLMKVLTFSSAATPLPAPLGREDVAGWSRTLPLPCAGTAHPSQALAWALNQTTSFLKSKESFLI